MKKEGLIINIFILLIILSSPYIQAQFNSSEEQKKVDKAYVCISDIVGNKTCEHLSIEEKIFSLLSINQCKSELLNSSIEDGNCWPEIPGQGCNLKKTAQAIIALSNSNQNTDKQQNWLISQNQSPTELKWYLQIESPEETTCTISYSPGPPSTLFTINLLENKTIAEDSAGPCLAKTLDGYWFEILSSSICQSQEFTISCDKNFLTTLLFKKTDSPIIHISQKSSSATSNGETKEKIKSFCFAQGGRCNYEGSLWAALALKTQDKDISAYLPYLITLSDEPLLQRILPDSFLYALTSYIDYKVSLLSKQIDNKWWFVSSNRFYDTALALYPFQQETLTEKTNTKNWLLENQDSSGCWDNNNLVNTAFILESIWPKDFVRSGSSSENDYSPQGCEQVGYYCVSQGRCEGQVLDYSCPGSLSECCPVEQQESTCLDLEGIICNAQELCRGREYQGASDLGLGEICCIGIGATCEERTSPPETDFCEQHEGACRTRCNSNEQIDNSLSCSFSTEVCCMLKESESNAIGKSYTWVWILSILILISVLGIIFKDKLRDFLLKLKSSSRRRPGPNSGYLPPRPPPHPPFPPSGYPSPRPTERKIISHPSMQQASQQPRTIQRPIRQKASSELDDVIKKLKEMGK